MLERSRLLALHPRRANQLIRASVRERKEAEGFESLLEPLRHYWRVSILHGEICNGGIAQYFTNSSGEEYREDLASLKAVGAWKQFDILQRWLGSLPNRIDPADRRQVGLYVFGTPEALAVEEELSQEYFRVTDAFNEALVAFALGNADAFGIG